MIPLRRLSRLLFLLAFLLPLFLPTQVQAQYTGPVYTVQEGESLAAIAGYFHTTTYRLATYNYITDYDLVVPGRNLTIPGFEDLTGKLTRVTVGLGDTPGSIARRYGSNVEVFNRINFLTSADAVYIGQQMFVINTSELIRKRVPVTTGLTGLELAAVNNVSPWAADEMNGLGSTWRLVPNDVVYLPSASGGGEILPGITQLSTSTLQQGKTAQFIAAGAESAGLSGSLLGYPLHFFDTGDGTLTALQGVPRMTGITSISQKYTFTAELTPILITTTGTDGSTYAIEQRILVKEASYGYDTPLQVKDETIDPAITEPETAFLMEQVAAAPAEKMWSGAFASPSPTPTCLISTYGLLRSYNDSTYTYFHTGSDYCGGIGVPIYAAADGVVVYTGELTVRGGTTILSHGRGVYTGYWHQSEIKVTTGQSVKAGDEIGLIGNSGRVTGPHLHFEVLVGSVQVDPSDWINGSYP